MDALEARLTDHEATKPNMVKVLRAVYNHRRRALERIVDFAEVMLAGPRDWTSTEMYALLCATLLSESP